MNTLEFDYYLPPELIAQKPADSRQASRMLVLDRSNGAMVDNGFFDFLRYLRKNDCLVINNTKVIPARFYAKKATGAAIEGLFLSLEQGVWKVMLKNSSKLKEGQTISLLDRDKNIFCSASVQTKLDEGRWLISPQCEMQAEQILNAIGFTPLPPYIKRSDSIAQHADDSHRYQTVYAKHNGAIAAPTAGLHFTPEILERITSLGISLAQVTLHVGAGTFLPVKTQTLEEHKIHSEEYCVDDANAAIINNAINAGGRVIAIGTTSVRTLETVAKITGERKIVASSGSTNLFILPGFEFKITDAMLTNFHLPKSTLLALVSAFAGRQAVLKAYSHAVEQKYRFYSYGDCMLII
jgi:S-adenosylmethionine:tRNA ribosyltransferase-isomerase